MTTAKSIAKSASKSRTAWLVGLSAVTALVVGTAVYFGTEKKAGAAPSPTPPGPTPTPGTTPVWTQLTPVANPQVAGTYMVTIPAGSTFAFADASNDANLPAILNGLNAAAANGTVTGSQSYVNVVTPSWWPSSDPFGNNGYRVTGVASSAFSLVLGPLSGNSPATTPTVWVVSGYH